MHYAKLVQFYVGLESVWRIVVALILLCASDRIYQANGGRVIIV